jgi:hypothetical protein
MKEGRFDLGKLVAPRMSWSDVGHDGVLRSIGRGTQPLTDTEKMLLVTSKKQTEYNFAPLYMT